METTRSGLNWQHLRDSLKNPSRQDDSQFRKGLAGWPQRGGNTPPTPVGFARGAFCPPAPPPRTASPRVPRGREG
eukprot:11214512-Alexandrium_andersonii.AAC.1